MKKLEIGEFMPFSVLKEDYENSSKKFDDTRNCPMATAAKRQLGLTFPNSFDGAGFRTFSQGSIIYGLEMPFTEDDYLDLEKGIEFHTTVKRIV